MHRKRFSFRMSKREEGLGFWALTVPYVRLYTKAQCSRGPWRGWFVHMNYTRLERSSPLWGNMYTADRHTNTIYYASLCYMQAGLAQNSHAARSLLVILHGVAFDSILSPLRIYIQPPNGIHPRTHTGKPNACCEKHSSSGDSTNIYYCRCCCCP